MAFIIYQRKLPPPVEISLVTGLLFHAMDPHNVCAIMYEDSKVGFQMKVEPCKGAVRHESNHDK